MLYMVSIFKILASNCLLPAYKNVIDFFMLTLYRATLLNSIIKYFCFVFYRFFVIFFSLVMLPVNRDSFSSSFKICMPFICFSCLIELGLLV